MKFSTKKGRMSNPNNNVEATVCRSAIMKRESQPQEAVAWCREHNCCGYLALKSGLFPLIKHGRTIDDRLDNKVITGQERSIVVSCYQKKRNP